MLDHVDILHNVLDTDGNFVCNKEPKRGWPPSCPALCNRLLLLKDFFDTWKFKILIAVAVFLVGVLAYAGANGPLTAAPPAAEHVAAPFHGGIGHQRRRVPVGQVHQH